MRAGAGASLPTEAQWEFAARGGRDGEDDWSSAFDADGKPIANTWQGIFPVLNTKDDGYAGTAPVGCFKPNGYGLYDMIGNVWEWTSDWYRAGPPARGGGQSHRPRARVAPRRPRAGREPRDQGRLPPVCVQLLRPLSPGRPACAGNQPGRGASRVPDRAQPAERRNVAVTAKTRERRGFLPAAPTRKDRTMIVTLRFARGIVLGLAAAGPVSISAAAAGEGSSDTGRPPPFGYYAIERGQPAPGAYSRPTAYGSESRRGSRTGHRRR